MRSNLIRICLGVVVMGLLSLSCSRNSYEGKVIAVEYPGNSIESAEGASLLAFDPDRPNKKASRISRDFESACSPALSHDARFLFFQGKKEKENNWQIWMMDLRKNKTRLVADLPENCSNPAPLPDGSVIFSRDISTNRRQYKALYRCERDGSNLSRLTFNQGENINASVLGEGRVLFSSSQVYPSLTPPDLMIMRPDGTKAEIFHRGTSANYPISVGKESAEGYIYFVNNKAQLMRVLHRRPLHTAEILGGDEGGSYAAATPLEGSECLVSWQASAGSPYAIYKIDTAESGLPVLVREEKNHLSNPILVKALGERPKILPTAVVPGKTTGLLMSQDINHSMLAVRHTAGDDTIATHIRILSTEGEIAIVEAKEDGSVYLELDADTPLRFETLNSQGRVVRGPSDWIYLRPNERRACVGCHADPELAPRNSQPQAVKDLPLVVSEKKK